jgi:hypothetical protein
MGAYLNEFREYLNLKLTPKPNELQLLSKPIFNATNNKEKN